MERSQAARSTSRVKFIYARLTPSTPLVMVADTMVKEVLTTWFRPRLRADAGKGRTLPGGSVFRQRRDFAAAGDAVA